MTHLTLHLLGPMSATLRDGERVDFAYDKVRALLAYLAVEHDREHPRSRLATLLWPENSESAARHSLSQALSLLRRSLDDRPADTAFLFARRESLKFDCHEECWVDLHEFNRLVTEAEQHPHSAELADCGECLWRLERAVALYRGPLLEGFSLADSEEFEDWLRSHQQALERSLEHALQALIEGMERSGNLGRACEFGQRLVDLDPWDDTACRTLMRVLAANGRRAASIKHFEDFRSKLETDLGLEPEPQTVELYDRIRAGLEGPTTFEPPVKRATPVGSTVPAPSTLFVGREEEVERIGELITSGESRLITLTGPGGIGKTRLAIRIVETLTGPFSDGVYFVPLTGIGSADLLSSAILDALSGYLDRRADPRQQLLDYVAGREMLLLLDNVDHLVEGAPLVAEMIEASPGLRIIATSRERLSLTGEWVHDVDGLSCPVDTSAPALATSGAARLFMLSARRHKSNFLPTEEDAPAVHRICHLTGGMPLALELAAAWIPVLSPDEIADEIERSLDFLSSSMRDLPARHRSVRAVMDRSWDGLTEVERRAFRRLSVFRGGFSRAAANYVTGASLPVLSALVSKSLLRRNQDGRFEIHELLRQYGESKLDEVDGEADVVRDRHRDYFLGFLAVREEQLEGKAQITMLGEVAAEIDNIRAAWRRGCETGDSHGLGEAAHSLWLFYETTGRYREGAAAMGAAFEALKALENIPGEQHPRHEFIMGRLRSRQSALSLRLVGLNVALEQQKEALQLVSPYDDPVEIGLVYNYMAVFAHEGNDYETQERYLLKSIEYFERAGHLWGLAYSRNDLGKVRTRQGDFLAARELHQYALGILEDMGDRRGMAFALRDLGVAASHLGETDLALELLWRSIEVRRPIGNQWGIAESLYQIGVVLRENGDPGGAVQHFHEALTIARDIRAIPLATQILQAYLSLLAEREPEDQHVNGLRSMVDDLAVVTDASESSRSVREGAADQLTQLIDSLLERGADGTEVTALHAST